MTSSPASEFILLLYLVYSSLIKLFSYRWAPKRREALYVYGENNGVIWDIVVNRTTKPYNSLFMVGAFDTETKTSQLQFCSVSEFDGKTFGKVRSPLLDIST